MDNNNLYMNISFGNGLLSSHLSLSHNYNKNVNFIIQVLFCFVVSFVIYSVYLLVALSKYTIKHNSLF